MTPCLAWLRVALCYSMHTRSASQLGHKEGRTSRTVVLGRPPWCSLSRSASSPFLRTTVLPSTRFGMRAGARPDRPVRSASSNAKLVATRRSNAE